MTGSGGIWGSLVPRLSGLWGDDRLNVRCNIATLTGVLAPKDPAALEALAEIAAEAIRRALHEDMTADAVVIQAVLAERDNLDENLKLELDKQIAQKLDRVLVTVEVTAESLLRFSSRVLPLLPISLLTDAFMSDARRLAVSRSGKGDPVERDRVQARLARLAAVEYSAPSQLRRDLRSALAARLQGLGRRASAPVLHVLLQAAPGLLEPVGGAAIATQTEFDRAARAGRPRLIRIMLRAGVSAAMVGGVLPIMVASVLTVIHGADTLDILGGAVLEWAWVGLIAFIAVLPAAWMYTPSLGRSFGLIKSLWRVLVPGMTAGLISAGLAFSFAGEGNATVGLVLEQTFVEYLLLSAGIAMAISLVLTMVPLAVPAHSHRGEDAEIWSICGAAGPAVATVTVGCEAAAVLGLTALSQLWPLLLATAAAAAVSVTRLEMVTRPEPRKSSVIKRPRWLNIMTAGSAVPVALALFGVLVSVVSHQRNGERQLELAATDAHWSLDFSLEPEHVLKVKIAGANTIRADFSVTGHRVEVDGEKNAKHSILHNGSTICIDRCEGYAWPWMADWLPLFTTGKFAESHVHGKFTRPTPAPAGDATVELTKEVTEITLSSGESKLVQLPEGYAARYTIDGKGSLGDQPTLAVFGPDENKKLTKPFPFYRLEPGTYRVCIYFNAIEADACDWKKSDRVAYESGQATVKISRTDR